MRRSAAYTRVPQWREILPAIEAGRREFSELLRSMELFAKFGLCRSAVHADMDVELHAFILGIPSLGNPEQIQTKSYLTYASHWIDDFFDSPARVGDAAQLLADRFDILRALSNMGTPGQVGIAMADRTHHPEAVYRALHRMLYGGIIQRCQDQDERRALLLEYRSLASSPAGNELTRDIYLLRPEVYWTTNKTVLELLAAADKTVDYQMVEVWNMIYAPAIFLQDAEEERARGELNFDDGEMPQVDEMVKMVRLAGRHLVPPQEATVLSFRQLAFVTDVMPELPAEIRQEYRAILRRWGH